MFIFPTDEWTHHQIWKKKSRNQERQEQLIIISKAQTEQRAVQCIQKAVYTAQGHVASLEGFDRENSISLTKDTRQPPEAREWRVDVNIFLKIIFNNCEIQIQNWYNPKHD